MLAAFFRSFAIFIRFYRSLYFWNILECVLHVHGSFNFCVLFIILFLKIFSRKHINIYEHLKHNYCQIYMEIEIERERVECLTQWVNILTFQRWMDRYGKTCSIHMFSFSVSVFFFLFKYSFQLHCRLFILSEFVRA